MNVIVHMLRISGLFSVAEYPIKVLLS